ncbi:10554_t:CDS:2 [Paraglomus occultum]|uniref:10554_t:CDS:1 n=1 Tax=Paraglomus occultum TaxID=144539 RepID=A0A9N9G7E0_9GLOM|nr:10554_t:CDS:2 [Paraglomus occultum]
MSNRTELEVCTTEEKLMQVGMGLGPAFITADYVQELKASESMPSVKKICIETLSSILEGRKLNPQGNLLKFSHKFYDHQRFIIIKEIISVVGSNYYNHGNPDHKVHTMILAPGYGGSGIGKSCSGWELQHLVTHADNFGFKFNIHDAKIGLFWKVLQNPLLSLY